MQPVSVKKGWCWVGERLDEVMKNEGSALRKVNGSEEGIFKAVAEIGRMVNDMILVRKVKGDHWSDKLGKKWEEDCLAAHMSKKPIRAGTGGGEAGVIFTSKVTKENNGSS